MLATANSVSRSHKCARGCSNDVTSIMQMKTLAFVGIAAVPARTSARGNLGWWMQPHVTRKHFK